MNPDNRYRGLLRRGAPLIAALAIGGGTGAGVYALTSGGSSSNATHATTPTAIVPAQPASTSATSSTSLTKLYSDDAPGVVDITVDSTSSSGNGFNPFGPGGGSQETQAEGTGFVIDTKGDIMTAEHVVDGANTITVRFQDGSTAKATLVGSDSSTDVAVIKVDVDSSKLHPLTLGDSSSVEPGQTVAAIGSPYGLPETLTAGIVSAIERTITAPNNFSIPGAIQTDASINHGNSGGPLIDVASNTVIGVNVQIESDSGDNSGVGFAVPVNAAKNVADTLIAGGTVKHAYLGVTVGDPASGNGAEIGCVVNGGPADQAGLQQNDVVTAVDGQSIQSADALTTNLGSRTPGDKVTLKIERGGSTKTVSVTLGSRPSSAQSNNCSQ
ncbi:MAG TPA: trypsin-like peptidase domain-containing protein [Gaiellaceae bacterium]|nr:trypsin-like peptidase domain-containing protein [Gaiellaceae bacterium]